MTDDPTYPEVGATRAGALRGRESPCGHVPTGGGSPPLPSGYRHVRRTAHLGAGPDVFHRVAAGMAAWRIHRDAGLTVRTDAERPALGVRFVTGIGFGPLRLWAPCRIVWFVDEPDRYGFGFGTLAGHPEHGEEAFLAEWTGEDDVYFHVTAFSRPAAWYARLGAAPARWLQDHVTDRYVAAAVALAGPPE
ncbi:MAG TPA: DUF1990 domain-containing protein [Actinocatenispora sp.]